MTLDTYADLFDDDLDAVADALDDAKATSVVCPYVVCQAARWWSAW
jgi:hypothetical protein